MMPSRKRFRANNSIGIGVYNDTVQDHQEVINRSEKALNEAVEAGGNRSLLYVVGEAEMADRERKALLSKQIRLALFPSI